MTVVDCIVSLCRWYVLIALLLAAWGKSAGFAAFRRSLSESFPALVRFDAALALVIVAAEWSIAAMLLFGGAPAKAGMIAALALFVLFTGVIGLSLAHGRAIVCSCFGAAGHRIGAVDVVRNLVLTAAALAVVLMPAPAAGDTLSDFPLQHSILAGIATSAVFASIWLRDLFWLLRARPVS